ncbi:MAG TPA: hypothetical protein VF715_05075 [Thermoleophilaceae bacterium]|jgi:hypothetical protein
MADASPSEAEARRAEAQQLSLAGTWRRLNVEQRVAAVGALLLIVSTLGPFSFVEAAIVLIGAGVLLLLRKRAEGRVFHVPFGDGAVIAAAGAWAGFLIFIRIVDRPLGQTVLALVCASILLLAGLRERAKRPPDDLPPGAAEPGRPAAPPPDPEERVGAAPPASQETAETQALPAKVLPPATPHGVRRRAPGPPADQPPLWDEPTD